MTPFSPRRAELARAVRAARINALLVAKPCNVSYLTGFTGDSSYCLVTPKRTILVSDDRFRAQIEAECPDLEAHVRGHDKTTYQAVGEVLSGLGLRDVGVESSGVTLEAFEAIRDECRAVNFVGRSGFVERLRAVKDDTEVEAIRNAIRVAEQGFT